MFQTHDIDNYCMSKVLYSKVNEFEDSQFLWHLVECSTVGSLKLVLDKSSVQIKSISF